MGNANITGATPNAKSPNGGVCSFGKWDGTTIGDDEKNKLKSLNAYVEVDEFCAPLGSAGFSLSNELCNNIGDNGEWAFYDRVDNNCTYNDCDLGYKVTSGGGCNGSCCGIDGGTVACARVKFSADPTVCCFNDVACDGQEEKCFQTPDRQATCDPQYRDITKNVCRDIIEPYCVGDRTFAGQTDWLEIWLENSSVPINSDQALSDTVYPASKFSPEVIVADRGKKFPLNEKQPCLRAIARNITLGNVCSWDDIQEGEVVTTNINENGLNWSRTMLNKVYDKYIQESGGSGLLAGINTDGVNRDAGFYNTLWNICNKVPLLCTNGADQKPEGILPRLCSNITTEDIIKTPEALKWCACHMPREQYEEYTNLYGLPKECTPVCNQLGVIPSIDSNGERKFCQDNTCIIDDNNINLTNSTITGGVNFNQICPGCGKNSIDRKFTRNSRTATNRNTNTVNLYSFRLTNPKSKAFLTNYYTSIYNSFYARQNFKNNQLYLKVLYIPDDFLNTPGVTDILAIKNTPNTTVYAPYKNINNDIENQLKAKFTDWTTGDIKSYLTQRYKISEVTMIFSLLEKTNCIGYADGGFRVRFENTSVLQKYSKIYSQDFLPLYFSDFDSKTSSYAPLLLDTSQQCTDIDITKAKPGFTQVTSDLYNETIVSETSNKFSTGSADSKVKSNTCTCIMNGVNLTTVNSRINGSINFTQECGKSECYAPDGSLISCAATNNNPISHDSIESIEIKTAIELEEEKYSTVFYILSAIMVLILILIIFFELGK
jgi:hypothetical protein